MKLPVRQKLYVVLATLVLVVHLAVAAVAKPSFRLTMFGDTIPVVLLVLAVLAASENFRKAEGILHIFWKLFAWGMVAMALSQVYWYYYDWRRLSGAPNPFPGDSLFLLAHVFFLSALALRPHSSSAGRDMRTRSLDFILLSAWWLSLYGYYCVPWLALRAYPRYNPNYYLLALLQHSAIIVALVVLAIRKTETWRRFYLLLAAAFVLVAGGNLLLNVGIDRGFYYAGGFYDTPFFLAVYMFTLIAGTSSSLHPAEDTTPNRELVQSIWMARFAMLGVLSLPFLALLGLYGKNVPPLVSTFRLKIIFGATFVFGILVYLKLSLLARELVRNVRLTSDSIVNLKEVQRRVVQSEKLIALGRLASGAAHEISNPLTAILGYSELLSDIPSLTAEDRANARNIQLQVHRAQAAVTSLRNVLRESSTPPLVVDKKPAS